MSVTPTPAASAAPTIFDQWAAYLRLESTVDEPHEVVVSKLKTIFDDRGYITRDKLVETFGESVARLTYRGQYPSCLDVKDFERWIKSDSGRAKWAAYSCPRWPSYAEALAPGSCGVSLRGNR